MDDYNNWIKNTDEETEGDEAEQMPSVEVCRNVEWVRENEINKDGIDESDLDAAANTYNDAVYDALTEKGWNVSWAKKERITFHGWNGARFTTKRGCVGSWGKLTDDQLAVIDEARKLANEAVKVWVVKTDYAFKTDSEGGFVTAENFDQAKALLHNMVPSEAMANGGWGWIEDPEGERYYIAKENME